MQLNSPLAFTITCALAHLLGFIWSVSCPLRVGSIRLIVLTIPGFIVAGAIVHGQSTESFNILVLIVLAAQHHSCRAFRKCVLPFLPFTNFVSRFLTPIDNISSPVRISAPDRHRHTPPSSIQQHSQPPPSFSMVFHNSKRRVRTNAKKETKSPFTALPDELLLDILKHADSSSDILRLRETCKTFLPACNTTIRTRLKTLYIHPASGSVKRAIRICHSDLGSEIEEICFVNKVHWSELRKDDNLEKDLAHNWPSKASHENMNQLNPAFVTHHEELLSSLASLSKVTTLSFKDGCDGPGFNMVPPRVVHDWVSTAKGYVSNISREQKVIGTLYGHYSSVAQPRSMVKYSFADLDAVVSLLNCRDFTTLRLTEELPFADAKTLTNMNVGNLTHIELHIHLGWYRSAWQQFCHELLRLAAPTLQHLKLAFRHNPAAVRRKRPEVSLAVVVQDLDFPKLQKLELCAVQLPAELPYAPQILDFTRFLSQHCKKLELLRVERVLPTREYVVTGEDFLPMDDILLDLDRETKPLDEHDEGTRAWGFSS